MRKTGSNRIRFFLLAVLMTAIVIMGMNAFSAEAAACKHKTTRTRVIASTCTSQGYTEKYCASCGASISKYNYTAKKAHSYNVSSATCTTDKRCTSCGYVAQKALGHSMSWVVMKQPNCKEQGYQNYKCSRCGYCAASSTLPTVPAHVYNVSAATCTTAKKCTVCGTVAQPALGHSMAWVTIKPATCTEQGYRNYKCTRSGCNHCTNSSTIDKIPHTYNISAATCTTDKKCTSCGHVAQAKLGHAMAWVTIKQPTCREQGYMNYQCTRSGCSHCTNSSTLDKLPHSYISTETIPATYENRGEVRRTCSCGYVDTAYSDKIPLSTPYSIQTNGTLDLSHCMIPNMTPAYLDAPEDKKVSGDKFNPYRQKNYACWYYSEKEGKYKNDGCAAVSALIVANILTGKTYPRTATVVDGTRSTCQWGKISEITYTKYTGNYLSNLATAVIGGHPCIVHSGNHYVAVVGILSTNKSSYSTSDFLCIDPVYGDIRKLSNAWDFSTADTVDALFVYSKK